MFSAVISDISHRTFNLASSLKRYTLKLSMVNITKYVIYNVKTKRVCVFSFYTIITDLYLYNNVNYVYKTVYKILYEMYVFPSAFSKTHICEPIISAGLYTVRYTS